MHTLGRFEVCVCARACSCVCACVRERQTETGREGRMGQTKGTREENMKITATTLFVFVVSTFSLFSSFKMFHLIIR